MDFMLLEVNELRKTYATGFEALKGISLKVNKGEILALLGPNGAGKTSLISTICGITNPSSGSVIIDGYDISKNFRDARKLVGLVPQDITLEPFEKVLNTINFSRGLFGKKKDDALTEKILTKLALWDKRDSRLMELSGGMSMWNGVADLKKDGVTIILTTHYIEEAEAIADRVGIINKGELLLVEEKTSLMQKFGQKILNIELQKRLNQLPKEFSQENVKLSDDGLTLTYIYDTKQKKTGITKLLSNLSNSGINLRDIQTDQSSLEEIFVNLVKEKGE